MRAGDGPDGPLLGLVCWLLLLGGCRWYAQQRGLTPLALASALVHLAASSP